MGESPFFQSGNPARFTDNSGESQLVRAAGILQYSDDGGANFNSLASFGSDTLVKLQNSVSSMISALRLLLSFRVNTPGNEESRWEVFLTLAGALTAVGGWAFNSAAFPIMFLGALANGNFLRQTSAGTWDMSAGGSAVLGLSATTVTALQALALNSKMTGNRAGAVATGTTIAWGIGNIQPVTGVGTINSISGLTTGFFGILEVPAGTQIGNNTAGTGTTILTSTGAAIAATPALRGFLVFHNGTNILLMA